MIEQIDYNLPSLQELKEKQRFYFNTQQVISEHDKLTCFKYSGIQKKKKTLLSYHLKKRKLYLIRDILTLIQIGNDQATSKLSESLFLIAEKSLPHENKKEDKNQRINFISHARKLFDTFS